MGVPEVEGDRHHTRAGPQRAWKRQFQGLIPGQRSMPWGGIGLLALCTVVAVVDLLHVERLRAAGRASAERQVAAVADLKVDRIVRWRSDRLVDARIVAASPGLGVLVADFQARGDQAARDSLGAWMGELVAGRHIPACLPTG